MMTTYTDKPRGVLPLAKGHSEMKNVLDFGKRNMAEVVENKHSSLGLTQMMRHAIKNPGIRWVQYHEENGYEYEEYMIFDLITNSLTTNYAACPRAFAHHVGDTCSMCGLKD